MSDTVIKIEELGKLYRLGEIGTGTISHDLNRWWARVRGKEDPFAKVGEANDRTARGSSDYVWALKDVNFEVRQGEVLGIIGRNGAGKSTLLKILSKVTTPSTGRIKVKGRIASLLEVGTGFHPELTGRENIFLNGAILGMTKAEIRSKFDEIVDFAGVERYIDTPVKRYSSGMYVRLAFAVAAFLEPEILIVDEVLAVGDAEFQKKCLGRMKDVSQNDGRTVLFVSHDMNAVSKLVSKCFLMKHGTVDIFGEKEEVINRYLLESFRAKDYEYSNANTDDKPIITNISFDTSYPSNVQVNGDKLSVEVRYFLPYKIEKTCITLAFKDNRGISCLDFSFFDDSKAYSNSGQYVLKFEFEKFRLYMGKYSLDVYFAEPPGGQFFEHLENACKFEVVMFEKSRGDWEWQPYTTTYIDDYNVKIEKV